MSIDSRYGGWETCKRYLSKPTLIVLSYNLGCAPNLLVPVTPDRMPGTNLKMAGLQNATEHYNSVDFTMPILELFPVRYL